MLRSRRRSLLCCALAFLLVHAFTPCPLTSSATNVAYAKKAVKKKRRKRKTVGQYVPFVLTTPAVPVASTAPAPPRPSTPAARSFTRAARVPSLHLQPINGRPPYPYRDDEQRKVARDAYVSWQGSRYSVPWTYAGKQVWVREHGREVEVYYGRERIAIHGQAPRKHAVITAAEHHRGIPLGARQERKTLIHIQDSAPVVEIRPLAAYESAAMGGAR